MIRNIVLFMMLMATAVIHGAGTYTADNLVNPNIADARAYVADPEGLLSRETVEAVNSRLWQLRQETSAEVVVAVLPSIGDEDIESFSVDLFEKWGVGKKDNDNGVLFLLVLDQHKGRIATGYGTEGVLTDAACATILSDELIPRMRDGDLNWAVAGVAGRIADVLSDPAAAAEVKSESAETFGLPEVLDEDVFRTFIMWMCIMATVLSGAGFFVQLVRSRGRDRYHKALMWRNARIYYIIGAVCSLGGALIFLLLDLWMAHRARNRARVCNHCHARMHKLSEEEDNAHLSPSEDLEEKLNTVDYDVWLCPQCGAVDKYAFPQSQTKYTRCPACGTVAMREIGRFTKVPATTRHAGVGERVTECRYCGHQNHDEFRIPKKDDGSGAAAALGAAAVLGSRNHGGGFGGGSFGGGFGGGHTGGGGATGSW